METTILTVNNVWMMICTALVFFMHLGFSFLEIGLTRKKNTVNILFKNFFVITIGVLIIANNKKLDSKLIEKINGKYLFFSLIIFFFLGIYGGFLNAGIGIVIMFILNRYNGLDLVKTNATKVVLITIYSSIALIVFAYNNSINWEKGLWMALGTIYGAWWSSRWSVKKGDKVIKIFMLIMIIIIAIKLWFFN